MQLFGPRGSAGRGRSVFPSLRQHQPYGRFPYPREYVTGLAKRPICHQVASPADSGNSTLMSCPGGWAALGTLVYPRVPPGSSADAPPTAAWLAPNPVPALPLRPLPTRRPTWQQNAKNARGHSTTPNVSRPGVVATRKVFATVKLASGRAPCRGSQARGLSAPTWLARGQCRREKKHHKPRQYALDRSLSLQVPSAPPDCPGWVPGWAPRP